MQYDPVLENLVGTLFLSPTGIPALTKARFFLVSDLHGLSNGLTFLCRNFDVQS